MMKNRGIHRAFALAAALAAGAVLPAARADTLRMCADPDNLPFSKAEGPQRGLYVEVAEAIGEKLGATVEWNWYYTQNQRRAMRNTILKNECDAIIALPAAEDYRVRGLVKTKPFLDVGYAVVAAPGFTFASLDDLKRVKLGVMFSSTPHVVLSTLGGFDMVTYRTPEEVFAALDQGEVRAAMVWGPLAGYENQTKWQSRFRITSVSGHDFAGRVVIGVRRDAEGLAGRIDGALAELGPRIAQLADKYAFPRDKPIALAQATPTAAAPRPRAVAVPMTQVAVVADATPRKDEKKPADKKPAAAAAAPAAVTTATAAPKLSEAATAGRVRFNDQCSHCHGTDGYSPVRERDLRYLKTRYADKWVETATLTIKNGRTDAGMPRWGEILKETDIAQLVEFFHTIQK